MTFKLRPIIKNHNNVAQTLKEITGIHRNRIEL